ncbi:MAG: Wzz/FepE/Etk N-terminal domain-containing protein, partial [Minisyncoccia bacterium]
MNSATESQPSVAQNESELIQIPIGELVIALFERRRFLLVVTGIGMLLAAGCALLIPNEFTSVAQLMPPDPLMFSSNTVRSALSGFGSGDLSSIFSGDLLSKRTPGQTA